MTQGTDLEGPIQKWFLSCLRTGIAAILGLACFIALNIYFLVSTRRARVSQEQLANASKMASLGQIASGVAHEINNPLMVIVGQIHLLRRALTNSTVHTMFVEERIDVIEKMTRRMSDIISGLKTFSRKSDLLPLKPCDLNEILNETISFCQDHVRGKGVELRYNPGFAKIPILGSPTEISQVVVHLFNNAVDAIQGLDTKWIELKLSVASEFVEIRVIDSGLGLKPEIQEKIFEPFFTTKPVGSGTGLGLSISYGLIKKNNGKLQIDNQSPNTCFVIRLPLHSETESRAAAG